MLAKSTPPPVDFEGGLMWRNQPPWGVDFEANEAEGKRQRKTCHATRRGTGWRVTFWNTVLVQD